MRSAPLVLGLAVSPTWLRGAAWRDPGSRVEEMFDLAPYAELAVAAEAAHLDFLFAPDAGHLDPGPLDRAPGFSTLDSHTLMTALAASTTRIGIVPTVQTLFASPFATARQLMSLHQISRGRAGWNAVTALGGSGNYDVDLPVGSDERTNRAGAFVDVVRELWASYPASALAVDRETGIFADRDRVRALTPDGNPFGITGPNTLPVHAAGEPPLFQAGASAAGVAFAGAYADVVFGAAASIDEARAQRKALRAAASAAGRPSDAVRFLPGVVVTIADSTAEADRIAARQDDGRGARHWSITGTPTDAVAAVSRWAEADAIDGCILLPGGTYGSIPRFLTEVVPILAKTGLARSEYTGHTLVEHLRIGRSTDSAHADR